jgi:hypothetical protein
MVSEGERVLGTVLMPPLLISDIPITRQPSQDEHLEVIHSIAIGEREVLVTRMGGLFNRTPGHFSDLPTADDGGEDLATKIAFQEECAGLFNLVQCELALRHYLITLPTVPLAMHGGLLIEGHAALLGGGGLFDRTIGPCCYNLHNTG